MPNVASVLKSEMARIGRKEARAEASPIRNSNTRLKKDVVELKRKLAALENQTRQLVAAMSKVTAMQPPPAADAEDGKKARLTSKGMISLRKKLKLTCVDFAKLLGTSSQTVYLWEHKTGPLKLRGKTLASIMQVRNLGVRDVKKILAEMAPEPTAAAKKPAVRKPGKSKPKTKKKTPASAQE